MKQKENKKVCGKPVIHMSRVVGYYSVVENWNRGKKSEWNERKTFDSSLK